MNTTAKTLLFPTLSLAASLMIAGVAPANADTLTCTPHDTNLLKCESRQEDGGTAITALRVRSTAQVAMRVADWQEMGRCGAAWGARVRMESVQAPGAEWTVSVPRQASGGGGVIVVAGPQCVTTYFECQDNATGNWLACNAVLTVGAN